MPLVGPLLEAQVLVAPVTVHTTAPAGAVAPTTPVTVAVNVTWLPNTGDVGEVVTAIVGVARVTVTDNGGVEDRAE